VVELTSGDFQNLNSKQFSSKNKISNTTQNNTIQKTKLFNNVYQETVAFLHLSPFAISRKIANQILLQKRKEKFENFT
jgi:hypothetical protein